MFKKWPKIPRLENEVFHITEKIDGTNGCIVIADNYQINEESDAYNNKSLWVGNNHIIFAQSRTKLITPEDDNYGFAKWVQANAEQLIEDLGVGYHFGEWWGEGINRNYGMSERRFSLFNPKKISNICFHVPYLAEVSSEAGKDLDYWLNKCEYALKTYGSRVNPGFMKSEGLVIYAEKAKAYWKVIF